MARKAVKSTHTTPQQETPPAPAASPPSVEAISQRAYELWEAAGKPEGEDQRFWFEAEQELRGGK